VLISNSSEPTPHSQLGLGFDLRQVMGSLAALLSSYLCFCGKSLLTVGAGQLAASSTQVNCRRWPALDSCWARPQPLAISREVAERSGMYPRCQSPHFGA
jgi:hypothetical protein